MGTFLLIAMVGTALAHAGDRERAHEFYLAGRYQEAEAMYRSALAGLGDGQTLAREVTVENLGVSLQAMGRLDDARPLMEEAALAIADLTGATSPEALQAKCNLAALYWTAAERDKAARLFRELLPFVEGERAVTFYGNLSAVAIASGDMAQAEDYARHGVELARRSLPAGHRLQAVLLNNLAQACRFNGRYLEAEQDYRDALDIWERSVGRSSPDYARGLMNLAGYFHERGREAGAEQLYLQAAEILAKCDPALELVVRNELADVLRAQLRYTEARKLSRSVLARMEATMRNDDPRLARARAYWDRLAAETAPRKAAALRAAR